MAALYAYPQPRWVRANMISSLDGAAQGPDGRSGTLGNQADRDVFALLRSLADVIVVGASTARIEGYGPAEVNAAHLDLRAGRPPTAPIAVVSRNLGLEPTSALFAGGGQRTIVVTVESSPMQNRRQLAEHADVIVAGETNVDAAIMLFELHERGLTKVLCEGGPELLGHLLIADVIDDLCLTVSPYTMGGGFPRIVRGDSDARLEWDLAHILEHESALLTRWTRRRVSA